MGISLKKQPSGIPEGCFDGLLGVRLVCRCGKSITDSKSGAKAVPALLKFGLYFGPVSVPDTEERLFNKIYSRKVNYRTDNKYAHNAQNRVQGHQGGAVHFHVFQCVYPQPPGHAAAGVDEKNAEGGCGNGVDESAVADIDIHEIQKGANTRKNGQKRVAVCHEYIPVPRACDQPQKGAHDDRSDAYTHGDKQHDPPEPSVAIDLFGVEPYEGGKKVYDRKPCDIVCAYYDIRDGAEKDVDETEGDKQRKMLLFGHAADKYVQKRYAQEKEQICGGEVSAHLSEGEDHIQNHCRAWLGITADNEYQTDDNFVKQHLKQELEKFSGRNIHFTAEIARDKNKAVYPGFSPCAENQKPQRTQGTHVFGNRAFNA